MLLPLRLQTVAIGSNLALQVMKNDDQKCFKLKVKIYLMKFLEADCQIKIFSFKKSEKKNTHTKKLPSYCSNNCTQMT